jgi:hypothetical protein
MPAVTLLPISSLNVSIHKTNILATSHSNSSRTGTLECQIGKIYHLPDQHSAIILTGLFAISAKLNMIMTSGVHVLLAYLYLAGTFFDHGRENMDANPSTYPKE